MDLLILSLHLSQKTSRGAKDVARYRTTTQEIIDWATRTIADAPHRTLPNLGLDLNDGVGLEKGRKVKSTALSTGCCQEEGFAVKLFREMLEEHKMYVASGHFRAFATYHCPNGGESSIDLIALPRSNAESIAGATVLRKS